MLFIASKTAEIRRIALTPIHQISGRAGAGVLLMSRNTERFLFLGSRYNEDHRKTMASFPGGRLESGESPALTAFWELYEETGLSVDRLYPFSFYRQPGRFFMTFLALIDGEPDPSLGNVDDHNEFKWFTLFEIEQIVAGRSDEIVSSGRVARLYEDDEAWMELSYMSVDLLHNLLESSPHTITANDVRTLIRSVDIGPPPPFLGW